MSPKQSRQSRPTRSPEVIEATLAAQRDQLVGDVEQLAARMAPQALTATARRSASRARWLVTTMTQAPGTSSSRW